MTTLLPGAYTVVMRGKNNSTGVGLIESYDLDAASDSELTNISTRGFVGTEGKVMIAGFIIGNESGNANLLIRALGPSLTAVGSHCAARRPRLELHDENGAIVMTTTIGRVAKSLRSRALGWLRRTDWNRRCSLPSGPEHIPRSLRAKMGLRVLRSWKFTAYSGNGSRSCCTMAACSARNLRSPSNANRAM